MIILFTILGVIIGLILLIILYICWRAFRLYRHIRNLRAEVAQLENEPVESEDEHIDPAGGSE